MEGDDAAISQIQLVQMSAAETYAAECEQAQIDEQVEAIYNMEAEGVDGVQAATLWQKAKGIVLKPQAEPLDA